MRLHWAKEADGVVTVYGTTSDGRKFAVADFWAQTMVDCLGVSRSVAEDYQQQHAELLVTTHNRIFTLAKAGGGDFAMPASPPSLDSTSPDGASVDWVCPTNDPECQSDCGSYGCGN